MAEAVLLIYEQGVQSGRATFNTQIPAWDEWDAGHLPHSRLVAQDDEGRILGWAALSAVSKRHPYRGVAEASIYIHAECQGRGVGSRLLAELITASEQNGIWCLYAGIFANNTRSLAMVRRAGFRDIGYREKIAELHGVWKNTVLLERRSRTVHWPVNGDDAGDGGESLPDAIAASFRNKQLIVDLLRQIDRRDLGGLRDFYAADYVEHNGGSVKNDYPGIAGVEQGFAAFLAAFDDYSHRVDDLLAEGDRVSARITFSGKFARPLFGCPPTGEQVTATGIAIYRIGDGKIREKWGYFNALEALKIPRPGHA